MSTTRTTGYNLLNQLISIDEQQLNSFAHTALTKDCVWHVCYPIETLEGIDAILEGFILPIRRALHQTRRRDELFISGNNRRDYGGTWLASVNHYVGNFQQSICGIAPCNRLVFLRSGEFYRMEGQRISEARIIIDFLDLMRQAGSFPLPMMLGTEMLFPGPATHDGVLPSHQGDGEKTLDLVEAMLADLRDFDPETLQSHGQTGDNGYWHSDMLWYGPAGIGSNYTWPGFEKDHRNSFLTAFPDRVGGDHYCRIGDGNYAAVSGWPSMTMTHKGDYIGVKATNKALTLRVMDFYRCADSKIMENWVMLDYLDLFHQMGVKLL